jgi:hypothetical protein
MLTPGLRIAAVAACRNVAAVAASRSPQGRIVTAASVPSMRQMKGSVGTDRH